MSESDGSSKINIISIAAIGLAVLALVAGVVLPTSQDIVVDIGLNDLNDVTTTGVTGNQTIVWNGSQWVPASFSNQSLTFGYDDLNFPALSLAKSAALAPTLGAIFGSGSIQGYLFDGVNQVNEVYGAGEILHFYKSGSDLTPHVHWMPTTTASGNVTWFLEYTIANVNSVYSLPPVIISATQAASGVAWTHQLVNFPIVNGTGISAGAQINFRLYRNATATSDTYAANAALISFGIHYQLAQLGTTTIP